MIAQNRPLTQEELALARWLLEHGSAEAREFLMQLDAAEVLPWRCLSGCASFKLLVKGRKAAPAGVHVLSEFLFGSQEGQDLSGVFIYSSRGTLSGVEVYGLIGDAPKRLPEPLKLISPDA